MSPVLELVLQALS
jgi:hypothetical protein